MQLPFASIPPAEKEKNFFDFAQILGPLPKAWPGGAACSVDRSGEEDSQNRPLSKGEKSNVLIVLNEKGYSLFHWLLTK